MTSCDAVPGQADRLRALIARQEILVLPCPYDALSARLAAEAGFDAMFMGGYGAVASRFAFPDIGLASATEMLETARAIIRAAGRPVICDGDTGYGGDANIRRTVLDLAQAGAAAVMIEDQTWPKRCGHLSGKSVVPFAEAVARIDAAVRAREESGGRILILARTDARGVEDLESALDRIRAFADAGADMLFMETPRSEAEMEAFTRASDLPCLANMLEGGASPILPPARLQELGFAMVAYPITLIGAAAAGVRDALAAIATGRPSDRRLSHAELLRLTGYGEPAATVR
ncbi:MAG: isocitrate lyase/PEP mutase family protein [Inquilinaceae bacterium]